MKKRPNLAAVGKKIALAVPEQAPIEEAKRDAFVNHELTPSAAEGRGILQRSTGKRVRRRVVYLPPELDREMRRWAAEDDREFSQLATEIFESAIAARR